MLNERRRVSGSAAVVTCEEVEEVVLGRYAKGGDGAGGGVGGGVVTSKEGTGRDKERDEGSVEENGEGSGKEIRAPTRTRERCRQAARRLAGRGEVVVTQKGKVVDPSFAKGVMELKLPST